MVDEIRMFPRWFYKQGEEPTLVANDEEGQALGAGWSDEAPQAPAPPAREEEGSSPPRRRS